MVILEKLRRVARPKPTIFPQVFECFVSGTVVSGSVELQIERARPIVEPLPSTRKSVKRKRNAAERERGASSESASDDAEMIADAAKDIQGSSSDSSGLSVDTDADSGLDDPIVAAKSKADDADAAASDLEEAVEAERLVSFEFPQPHPTSHTPGCTFLPHVSHM